MDNYGGWGKPIFKVIPIDQYTDTKNEYGMGANDEWVYPNSAPIPFYHGTNTPVMSTGIEGAQGIAQGIPDYRNAQGNITSPGFGTMNLSSILQALIQMTGHKKGKK